MNPRYYVNRVYGTPQITLNHVEFLWRICGATVVGNVPAYRSFRVQIPTRAVNGLLKRLHKIKHAQVRLRSFVRSKSLETEALLYRVSSNPTSSAFRGWSYQFKKVKSYAGVKTGPRAHTLKKTFPIFF